MKNTKTNLLSVRRLSAPRVSETDAANELGVECPLAKTEVLLQRCAFCEHGRGLLLDPSSNDLTLRCSFSESIRAKPLSVAHD